VLVDRLGDRSRLDTQCRTRDVDRVEPPHAFEADYQLTVSGDRASRQTGAPSRRHDLHVVTVAEGQ
jgi:hypothetical protein